MIPTEDWKCSPEPALRAKTYDKYDRYGRTMSDEDATATTLLSQGNGNVLSNVSSSSSSSLGSVLISNSSRVQNTDPRLSFAPLEMDPLRLLQPWPLHIPRIGNNNLLVEWSPSVGRAVSSKRGYVVGGSPGVTKRAEPQANGGPRSGETIGRRRRFAENNRMTLSEQRSRSGPRTKTSASSDERMNGKPLRSQPTAPCRERVRPRNPRPTERQPPGRRSGSRNEWYSSHGQHGIAQPSWSASAGLGLEMSPSRRWVRPSATGPLNRGNREEQGVVERELDTGAGPWVALERGCCRGGNPGRRSKAMIVLGPGSRARVSASRVEFHSPASDCR